MQFPLPAFAEGTASELERHRALAASRRAASHRMWLKRLGSGARPKATLAASRAPAIPASATLYVAAVAASLNTATANPARRKAAFSA